jgi:hypothetical protein
MFSQVLSTRGVLVLGLLLTTIFTGLGTYLLARTLDVDPVPAICASILGAFGPPTLNKLVAGHWYYMISIAALPWAFAFAFRNALQSLWGAVATGVLIAWSSLQPQLWVSAEFGCVLFALSSRRSSLPQTVLRIAIMICCGAVLTVPEFFGTMLANASAQFADVKTVPFWEANNSASPAEALIGAGYFAGYADAALAAVPLARYLLWLVPIGAALRLTTKDRHTRIYAAWIFWLVTLFVIMGVKGPFGPLFQLLFAHYLWASTFRELYHFAEPMWIVGSVLACGALAKSLNGRLSSVAYLALLASIILIWSPAGYAGQLQSWDLNISSEKLLRQLGPHRFVARFALLPAVLPLGPKHADFAGADPDAYPIPGWLSANLADQRGVLEAILERIQEGDPDAVNWMRTAGIARTLARPYLASKPLETSPLSSAQKQQAEALFLKPAAQTQDVRFPQNVSLLESTDRLPILADPFNQHFTDGFLLPGDAGSDVHDPDAVPTNDRYEPLSSGSSWDPATGWAPARMYGWLDSQVAFWDRGLVTWSKNNLTIPAQVRTNGYVHVVLYRGRLLIGTRRVSIPLRKAVWISVPSGSGTLSVEDGALLVIEFAKITPPYRAVHRNAQLNRVRPLPFSPDCACAQFRIGPQDHWIVLKQDFSSDWILTVTKGAVLRHVRYAGYGNAWALRTPEDTVAYLNYAPQKTWAAISNASLYVWLFLAVISIWGLRVRKA